jgi:hypothetical protein
MGRVFCSDRYLHHWVRITELSLLFQASGIAQLVFVTLARAEVWPLEREQGKEGSGKSLAGRELPWLESGLQWWLESLGSGPSQRSGGDVLQSPGHPSDSACFSMVDADLPAHSVPHTLQCCPKEQGRHLRQGSSLGLAPGAVLGKGHVWRVGGSGTLVLFSSGD